MKLLTKLTLITSAAAFLGGVSAFAGDSQLANRLAIQQTQIAKTTTTVALFSNNQGLGAQADAQQAQLAQHANGHGQSAPLYR